MLLANLLTFLLPLVPELAQLPKHRSATLLFAGDAMMHEAQISASRTQSGTHDFSACFTQIRPLIEEADFAVVNFEASLGGKPYRGYPCFSAPDEYPLALIDAGFDFFLLANNHILDRRDRGLHRTITTLDSLGIPHTGIYHDVAARDSLVPRIINVNDFKIGLLNYTYGTNGITVQGKAIVDYINPTKIEADVKATRKAGAEVIAVCIHWGDEYHLLPNASQKAMADKLVAMGVDLIIGSHPHVIQPMEMHPTPDGRQALVVYSLGNLISNMRTTDTRGGALVRVQLERDSTGQACVASADYSLVFVEPGKFRLTDPIDSNDPRARAFAKNAHAIFDKHNQNVPQRVVK